MATALELDCPIFQNLGTGEQVIGISNRSLQFADNRELNFGDAQDVAIGWDGTNLNILPVADDTGTINIGNGTVDMDVKVFLSTTTKYVLFDVGNALLTLEDVDLKLGDNDSLQFGDASGGDISIVWNGTLLAIIPATDDTGAITIGNGTKDCDFRVYLGTTSDYVEMDMGNKALEIAGDVRIDLSACTLAAANTDGGVIKGGTSGAPITEDTANMKFISFYFDDGATSGEAVGIYDRLYVTGAGGEGIALRAFCSVTDVAAANARGAHISLSFGASGSVTGLGTALETTLHIPTTAGLAGTVSSIKAAINSDGANSDPVGSLLSVFDVVNQGNATGMADVDDDCALVNLGTGWVSATGNMVYTHTVTTPGAAAGSIKIRVGGTPYYLYFWATEGST